MLFSLCRVLKKIYIHCFHCITYLYINCSNSPPPQLSWFLVFPDMQGHLGHVQGQGQPGVGQDQGLPQGLIFLEKLLKQKLLGMIK